MNNSQALYKAYADLESATERLLELMPEHTERARVEDLLKYTVTEVDQLLDQVL